MNQNEVKRRRIQGVANILALVTVLVIGNMAGDNGVTYMSVAMLALGFLWTLIGTNTADTLGRLLRIRNSKGQYKNAEKMRKSVMLFQMILGLLGAILLLFGARVIGDRIFHTQYSVFLIMLLAPALFFRAVSYVLMGICQGEGAELPTAVACILRQVFILVFSLIFCNILGNYGAKVSRLLVEENFTSMYVGAGAAIAVTVSEVFVTLFLLVIRKVSRHSGRREQPEGMRSTDSFVDVVRNFCAGRVPQAVIRLFVFLPVILGFLFFEKSVADIEAVAMQYGVYLGKYLVLCCFFILLATGSFINVYSRAVIALRKEEQRLARAVFQSGVHIAVIHSLFFAVFLAVTATQAAGLLDESNGAVAEKLFRGGSMLIPFVVLAAYFSRFLVLTGKKLLVLGALGIADVLYVVSMTLFLNVWKVGILSLVYAGILGSAVCCFILAALTYRQLRIGSLWQQNFIVPGGVACVSGLFGMLLCKIAGPHLGHFVTLLICFLITAVIYWVILLLVRNIREQELEYISGGRLITAIGQMLHIF